MSRCYRVWIEIDELPKNRVDAVVDAINAVDFVSEQRDAWSNDPESETTSLGFGNDCIQLGGGRMTEEHARDWAVAAVRAAGAPLEIRFSWWYEEREPDDTDYFDMNDCREMLSPLEQLADAAE